MSLMKAPEMPTSIRSFRPRVLAVALSCCVALSQLASATELLSLVGADAAACVHLKQAKTQSQRLEASEFARRIVNSTFYENWQASPDSRKLRDVETVLTTLTGKPVRRTLEELFGQEALLALYIGPGTQQTAVLLLNAESPEALDAGLKHWQQLDQFEVTKRQHRDREYVRLSKTKGNGTYFYAADKTTLVLSEDESLIRRTLDLLLDQKAGSSLLTTPEAQAALQRGTEQDLLAVHLNPRAWDSTVLRPENPLPPVVEQSWRRCRWISLRASLNDDLAVSLTADYDGTEAPDWWQRLAGMFAATELPIDRLPENVVLAATGKTSAASVRDLIQHLMGNRPVPKDIERARRIARGLLLGLDPLDDVLPQLGPNWTAFVVPRAPAETTSFPADGLIAIELRPAEKADKPTLHLALDNALTASLNMIAALQNARDTRETAIVGQRVVEGVTIRSVGPIGQFAPSVLVSDRTLVIASRPELCEQFLVAQKSTERTAPALLAERAKSLARSGQLGFINVQAGRAWLTQRREWFLKQATKDNVTADEAARRLKEFDELLSLLDGTYLTMSADQQLIEVKLGAIARKP